MTKTQKVSTSIKMISKKAFFFPVDTMLENVDLNPVSFIFKSKNIKKAEVAINKILSTNEKGIIKIAKEMQANKPIPTHRFDNLFAIILFSSLHQTFLIFIADYSRVTCHDNLTMSKPNCLITNIFYLADIM